MTYIGIIYIELFIMYFVKDNKCSFVTGMEDKTTNGTYHHTSIIHLGHVAVYNLYIVWVFFFWIQDYRININHMKFSCRHHKKSMNVRVLIIYPIWHHMYLLGNALNSLLASFNWWSAPERILILYKRVVLGTCFIQIAKDHTWKLLYTGFPKWEKKNTKKMKILETRY